MTRAPQIVHGDCLEIMKMLPDNSVDSIVTDPPYGLGFMGKKWDALPPGQDWAEECLRVLKPGGHLLAFGGSRTWHRLAVAVEDAGFEIRDSIAWLYGSGFPKSLDVSKAIDKAAGATREVTGRVKTPYKVNAPEILGNTYSAGGSFSKQADENGYRYTETTAHATPAAEQWQGWGTALKPAFEPIVFARKPLIGTVAANVQAHGTGALNIDGCRIGTDMIESGRAGRGSHQTDSMAGGPIGVSAQKEYAAGRWPANVALDEHMAAVLDEQSGVTKSTASAGRNGANVQGVTGIMAPRTIDAVRGHDDQGGASRFFYVAKAPKKERPVVDGVAHATVKPLALMRWLVRLVTPEGGTVLEPFAGSGTTVEACILEGFHCIAIEREAEYLPLIQARIDRQEVA